MDNFFENEPLDEPKKMLLRKKFYLLRMMVKNAKWWSKSNLPLFLTAKCLPFKRVLKICAQNITKTVTKLPCKIKEAKKSQYILLLEYLE